MRRNKMVAAMMDAAKRLGITMDYTDASAILGRLEHEGMLPPKVEYHSDNGVLDSVEYEWEPEEKEEEDFNTKTKKLVDAAVKKLSEDLYKALEEGYRQIKEEENEKK